MPQGDLVARASLGEYIDARGLRVPTRLAEVFQSPLPSQLPAVICWPGAGSGRDQSLTMSWAESVIGGSDWPLLHNLVPLALVDEKSFACVVCSDVDGDELPGEGAVVRWHLDVARPEHQAALLDTDCYAFVQSLVTELGAREAGLDRLLKEIGPAYALQYLEADRRPRDFVVRPVRIACQNVIVGMAAFAYDSAIDGMSVVAWQTCEVPHVATHEGNRALAALMLCDAFQSGGTMEIRFDRPVRLKADGEAPRSGVCVSVDTVYDGHPEREAGPSVTQRVPASLRRYGRTAGIPLGADNAGAISPAEARKLFLAVTPMPEGLANRVNGAWEDGVATPERLCFTLLAQIWREVELDFMLAVSRRTGSILRGGADWCRRAERQAESEVARAALMVGMLHRRLDTKDGAGTTVAEARVLEDSRVGVSWEVLPEVGAIRFYGTRGEDLPWQDAADGERCILEEGGTLTVFPRSALTTDTLDIASSLSEAGPVAIAIPKDGHSTTEVDELQDILLLRCPDRLGELDQTIEKKLLSARIARA